VQAKKARAEYFFRMLRDPATNTIPPDIRQRELAYARTLPRYYDAGGVRIAGKAIASANGTGFTWEEAGPTDVGGRTRALAVSRADSNVVIAGGVSGGIWKSTDRGQTWTLKTPMNTPLSVTWIAQDPRSGMSNVWYYVSGERTGSADDLGGTAPFFGNGIYKSTDNGETWLFLSSSLDSDPTVFNGPFDFLSKIVVSPSNGHLYVASNGFGIYRSANGGASFSLVLGGSGDHQWSDVDVADDGTLIAVISATDDGGSQDNSPGVYRSTNNGDTWTDITPSTFPDDHSRSVVALAPSNQDVAYVLTSTGGGERSEVKLHRIIVSTGASEDRSAGIPDFGDPVGYMSTQGDYNMAIAVKPDDEHFVLIGGIDLFRSTDGFATRPTDPDKGWIGGYATANDVSPYENQHADQHVVFFDPVNPKMLWAGHDGGISRTLDVTAEPVAWEDMNSGYNVTQFYTVALPRETGVADLTEVGGGTQDNGTPVFDFTDPGAGSEDITTGDGAFIYIGKDLAIASSQMGVASRYDADGFDGEVAPPSGASGTPLFIHPFAVDPGDEETLYYPVENVLWRNTQLSTATTSTGWTELTGVTAPSGMTISALAATAGNPAHRLYYGASDGSGDDPPRVFRLDNAHTATNGETDISIPDAPDGAYLHNIAVNPHNGDELLVVMSNYNIVGLYHSTNGGQSYTAVEGNLEGSQNTPGPSLRWAAILPIGGITQYLVATSVGLFSTTALNGANTVWVQEGADLIGNTVVAALDARPSDGTVAAATHGRGIFIGTSEANQQTIQSDTSTVTFVAGDGSQTAVTFTAGSVAGHTVTYLSYGRSLPGMLPGESPPSIPVRYFNLSTSIPDTTTFTATLRVTYTLAQLDSAGVAAESTLVLFRYDAADSSWNQVATTVDTLANTATAATSTFSTWALASATPTGIPDTDRIPTPRAFALQQNFPNPFNPETTIRYTVPQAGPVRLVIYNIQGQEVSTLVNGVQSAGTYQVVWNGRNAQDRPVSSGVYLYRLTAGDAHETKRMTLVK
jgi:hypothetical protein